MELRQVLEQMGDEIEVEVEPGDIVTDVICLLRVQRLSSTNDGVIIAATENTGGVVQYGMVRTANLQIEDWMLNGDDD